jgi:5-methylcytosine-specific restriction enzyme subunit McrC
LAASILLLRLPDVPVSTRQTLRQLAGRLADVGPLLPSDTRTETVFNRLNEHHRPAERLARIALTASSLLDEQGVTGAGVFLVNMNKVFEEFVEARLRRYLADRLDTQGQWHGALDVAGCVRIKPDLVFRLPGSSEIGFVADSKYKVTDDGWAREADYYQLLAYTVALNLHEGLLIYCQHGGTTPPREIEVRSLKTRLRTWAVRLDRTPQHIEAEMRALADAVAGWAADERSLQWAGLNESRFAARSTN